MWTCIAKARSYMKYLRRRCLIIVKVAFGPFGNTFSTPTNEHMLWEACVRIFHFYKRELDSAIGELINQIKEFSLYFPVNRNALRTGRVCYA